MDDNNKTSEFSTKLKDYQIRVDNAKGHLVDSFTEILRQASADTLVSCTVETTHAKVLAADIVNASENFLKIIAELKLGVNFNFDSLNQRTDTTREEASKKSVENLKNELAIGLDELEQHYYKSKYRT